MYPQGGMLDWWRAASEGQACEQPSTVSRSHLFAVLGVLSRPNSDWRHAIRDTWMRALPEDPAILVKLVMRGIGASKTVRQEAARFNDTIFLAAPQLDGHSGPLVSALLWLRCASQKWPNSRLIGKAEDDVWLHLPGVFASVRASLADIARSGYHELYWGMEETYLWNRTAHRPLAWGAPWGLYSRCPTRDAICRTPQMCLARSNGHVGPFAFMKVCAPALSAPTAPRIIN